MSTENKIEPNPFVGEEDDLEPNAFLGLGINPIDQNRELRKRIQGAGTMIDQMFLYVSPNSAEAWLEETGLEGYKAVTSIPIDDVTDGIARRIDKMMPGQKPHLDLISLGSGEAAQEQRIIQTLIRKKAIQSTNLYLVDSSYPLVTIGLESCQKVFRSYPEVKTRAVYQNFYHLPQTKKFLYSLQKENQVKLVTMLGYTFSNLEQEAFFLRDTLNPFPSKTMLLIDTVLAYGSADNTEEIIQNEPWLSGQPVWARLGHHHWAMPFIEHHSAVKTPNDVRFAPVLDNRTCQFKGSYAIEIRAIVGNQRFTIQRLKRYEMQGFVEGFRQEGWSLVSTYEFYDDQRMAVLFQKD